MESWNTILIKLTVNFKFFNKIVLGEKLLEIYDLEKKFTDLFNFGLQNEKFLKSWKINENLNFLPKSLRGKLIFQFHLPSRQNPR